MLLEINGGKLLSGEINLQGSKNGSLALLAGAIITKQKIKLINIPQIEDVNNFLKLSENLGVTYYWDNSALFLDASNIIYQSLNKECSAKLRASIYFLPIMASLNDNFELNVPGGCNLGKRPIDFHLDIIRASGGEIEESEDNAYIKFNNKHSFTYTFPNISVGGTINALLLASSLSGVTTLENCAKEVEVKQLISFLKLAGIDIIELNGTYIVKGTNEYKNVGVYSNRYDRIAAASYITLGLCIGKNIKINNAPFTDINDYLSVLDIANLKYNIEGKSIQVYQQDNNSKLKLTCQPWPGLSTDVLPIIVPLFLKGDNLGLFKDEVYCERTKYLEELKKLGLIYTIKDSFIFVRGSDKLQSAELNCTDLRGGMAMLIAALMVKGKSILNHAEVLLRGYENLFSVLNSVGADIKVYEN